MPWWESFLQTFVPLFIVFDAWGTLPIVLTLSGGMSQRERLTLIHHAVITAAVVGLIFLFFGQLILAALGISVGSLAIAGGLVLLVLSIRYMTTGYGIEGDREEMVAVVPIGTPLLSGPATITTLLLLAAQYPLWVVLFSFTLNVLIAWVIFLFGNQISGFLGVGGLKATSRVFNLLLAAIAVNMILRGLELVGVLTLPSG